MKRQVLPAVIAMVSLCLSGCGNGTSTNVETESEYLSESVSVSETSTETVSEIASEYFSERDFEIGYDESTSTHITLEGDSASSGSQNVQITGGTIRILDEGTYIFSGTLDDGMIIVDSEKTDKIQIVLKDASINSETSAPIYILQADKVFITTAKETDNVLSNGGTFTAIDDNNIDSVIFSKDDVTLNGSGTLTISSPAGHGIVSKDSLTITSGSYDISCANHALSGKDDVCIANADFTLTSGKDGIHAENADDDTLGFVYIQSGTFNISCEGDGISSASYMQIEDGTFNIVSGGGSGNASLKTSDSWGEFKGGGRGGNMSGGGSRENMPVGGDAGISEMDMQDMSPSSDEMETDTDSTSMKGIKAGKDMIINGGSFTMNSADDAVHSNTSVKVNGGIFEIASGDDAFHAEEALDVTNGNINITESYEGLEALNINITGGDIKLVATDDGLNAAGGKDSSGMTGGRDGMFGQGMASNSNSNGTICISGGTIDITVSGDGIDANGSIEITGGYTVVCGPTQGDTATLDYDTTAVISGGTFIGTGALGMAQSFSDADQGVIAISVGQQSEGTQIQLADSTGNEILTYTPGLSYAVFIYSSPDIVKGESYTVLIGSDSGTVTAN